MKYSESDIERIRRAADIRQFVPDLHGRGTTLYCTCPKCGATGKGKGLLVTHKSNIDIAKCFKCDFTLNGAIDAVMYFEKLKFPDAVKFVADRCGIYLQTESEKRADNRKKIRKRIEDTFVAQQLEASGLTLSDVIAQVKSSDAAHTVYETSPFQKGGIDALWNTNPNDDEMLIHYYDLWGQHVQYASKGAAGRLKDYVRVRWSNPELHLDQAGRPIKYQTPKGAQTKFYIPQYIRALFQQARPIDTLIIQEGEKKAEKACKHHIPSIGIQGIYNIGNEQSGLIKDLQYLVQTCHIRNLVLMFDSDWDHLHHNISPGDHIDQRPNQFAKAVIKFKQYILTMHNLGISVDVYFGHIKENESQDKGIDDLLVNTLAGKEDSLKEDIERTLFSHDGHGQYVDIFKISTKSDFQIRDYWMLNDRDAFFERHAPRLNDVQSFRFGSVSYHMEDGKAVRSTRYSNEREFWTYETNDKGQEKAGFLYEEALSFINENGFRLVRTLDCEPGQYKVCRIENGVVSLSSQVDIRNFIYAYVCQSTKRKSVREMFTSRLGTLLGPDKLERVETMDDNFEEAQQGVQRFFFRNGCLSVTAQGMEFGGNAGYIWSDRVIGRSFRRVPIIESITYSEKEGFHLTLSEEGAQCEFLQFLMNVSNFWRDVVIMNSEQSREFSRHLVNKLTAMGFLLADYKYQSELKAVVAMDAQMSEVGQSNGRSGKSLIGVALSKMMAQAVIDGRKTRNDDEYIYSNVTMRTRNIFIDDVRVNFDFENFFPAITGELQVNPKTKARFTIPNDRSPKIYITTNHAINAQNGSARDRMSYMSFSDWYSDTHHPVDDFGHQFFADWDETQWNLFDNLMCECCMYYFLSMENRWHCAGQGIVPPPMEDIRRRTLKQQMGEAFFQWAEAYFDEGNGKLNCRLSRRMMYDDFHASFPESRLSVTPSNFKEKLKKYCEFRGLHFNITRPSDSKDCTAGYSFSDWKKARPGELFVGGMDKSGGVEYFTLANDAFANKQPY